MWFLSFIPDSVLQWFVHLVLILGLILAFGGSILSKIPFISSYTRPAKLVGYVLVVLGVFFEGSYATEMKWRERVRVLEEKVKQSEIKSAETNKQLSQSLLNKKEQIQSSQKVVKEELNKYIVQIDSECKVNPKAIELMNQSAKNPGGKK